MQFSNSTDLHSEFQSALKTCTTEEMIAFEIVNYANKILPNWKTSVTRRRNSSEICLNSLIAKVEQFTNTLNQFESLANLDLLISQEKRSINSHYLNSNYTYDFLIETTIPNQDKNPTQKKNYKRTALKRVYEEEIS